MKEIVESNAKIPKGLKRQILSPPEIGVCVGCESEEKVKKQNEEKK